MRHSLSRRSVLVPGAGSLRATTVFFGLWCGKSAAQTVPAAAPPAATPASATQAVWPGLTSAGTVLLPSGWSLRPAGRQSRLGDFPVQIAVHPSEPVLAILHAGYGEHEVVTVSSETGRIIDRVSLAETFAGLVWSADGKQLYVGGGFDDRVYRFDHAGGLLSGRKTFPLPPRSEKYKVPGGLALSADGKTLWIANVHGHSLDRLDLAKGAVGESVALEADSYPYGLAWDEPGHRLYVSLWNRAAVAVIDTQTHALAATIAVQEHPNELLLARGGKVLYVANANRNTVSVIDTLAGKAVETIGTAIDPARSGVHAQLLGLEPDESVLLVASANTNHLTVVNVKETGAQHPARDSFPRAGIRPPCGSRVTVRRSTSPTARGRVREPTGTAPTRWPRPAMAGRFASTSAVSSREHCRSFRCPPRRGCRPTPALFTSAARSAAETRRPSSEKGFAGSIPSPDAWAIPRPSSMCVYIIKENRTYDQVFGDIPEGNGDPSLCLFPEAVTPNHHALAREFVLLDNFYVDGEVSADGHEWSMGAYATDFVEKTWPLDVPG